MSTSEGSALTDENRRLRERIAELEAAASQGAARSNEAARAIMEVLIDRAPVGFCFLDADLRYLYINAKLAELNGVPVRDHIGRTVEEIVPAVAAQAREAGRRIVESGAPILEHEFSGETLAAPGELRYWEESWYPAYSAQGEMLGFGVVVKEITEQKRAERLLAVSEAKYRSLFTTIDQGYVLVDVLFDESGKPIDLLCVESNPAARQIAGEDHTGRRLREIAPAGELCMVDIAARVARTGRGERLEWRSERLKAWFSFYLFQPENAPRERVAVIFENITERKQAEESLREAQKDESIGVLAGGVAHDFNNLLVGVIGNASLAQELLPPGSPAADLLDRIVKAGEQAAHLTRQLLAYAGKGNIISAPVDLSAVVCDVTDLIRSTAPKKVAIQLDLAPGLPLIIGDRGQIHQVIMNLIINATEAIGEDAGVISVQTGELELSEAAARRWKAGIASRSYAFLKISDTGCGMDEATASKIFDPFFTTKFLGRGLGLAAVTGILRSHKGAIRVTSAPGKGSSFTVILPAARAQLHERAPAVSQEPLRRRGSVLVVDDEEAVRTMLKTALERCGFDVVLAASGAEAIRTMSRLGKAISTVFLDVGMPGMNGHEALPKLLAANPRLAVIVSSGYPETEATRPFEGMPIAGYIQKPYTVQKLVESLRTILERRQFCEAAAEDRL